MASCLWMMSFLLVVLMGFLCAISHARRHMFYVGENEGWAPKPSESYNQWAEKYHFFVHDELVFKYERGHDSVLVVNEKDYYKCNKDNPIKVLKVKNGESRFKFHQPGPFFFISGHDQNCEDGQKLIVLVHPNPDHPHHRPSPSPETPPVQPPSQSPSPAADAPPSDAPCQSPAADTPFPGDAPLNEPLSNSPSQSPEAQTILAHAPADDQPRSQSPLPSTRDKAPVPSDTNIALPPHLFSPHHAPAPAPSSASHFWGFLCCYCGINECCRTSCCLSVFFIVNSPPHLFLFSC